MDIKEKQLFELLGRKEAQIFLLQDQIRQHQIYASKLQDEIKKLKDATLDTES